MVYNEYKIIRFNKKELIFFERLYDSGVIVEPFDTFVKHAFYDKINQVRIRNLNREFGRDDHEDRV